MVELSLLDFDGGVEVASYKLAFRRFTGLT